jgi:hypothetical protein
MYALDDAALTRIVSTDEHIQIFEIESRIHGPLKALDSN